ncbi:olfactomedin-4-like [Aulostomus maculatus]
MKLCAVTLLSALLSFTQASPQDACVCELNTEKTFPQDKLNTVGDGATQCNTVVTPQKTLDLEILLLGLERRMPQLLEDLSILEREDDGQLYGAISLRVIENELTEIKQLIDKLNTTTRRSQKLTTDTNNQLRDLKAVMQDLEKYDTSRVVEKQKANQRLKRDLHQCKESLKTIKPTLPPHGESPYGHFVNVSRPIIYTAGEYPGSYKFGAWGRDPKPGAGKENWYWLVMLTSSNKYANYVRRYSSQSSLIVGVSVPGNVQIHASNPTTNTIQGPNVVMYGEALYYNCYNNDAVCRFNLANKTVSTLQLPKGTRFNSKGDFCHLDACYPFTDIDLATDESGVWVIYTTTQDAGNLVLSKIEGYPPMLGQTWRTSVYKKGVTNTFVAWGVLYATRYISEHTEEIFYSFDTSTGAENFNVGIFINKMQPNIYFLNYSPVDQMLHTYSEAYMVSYKILFE